MAKYFNNVNTIEELRKQYRDLLKKYHPDNANGSTEATQEINAEYDKLFKVLKDKHENKTEQANETYNREFDEALREQLNKIIHLDVEIEIIGTWIWITGSTFPVKEILRESGFKFSGKKKAWYWKKETFVKKSRKSFSLNDIRNYYGSEKIQREERNLITA